MAHAAGGVAARLARGPLVIDGGLGTLLDAHGHDLASKLWSARLLAENPAAIERAHSEFFAAGAEVAITGSYQVSFEGLQRAGYDEAATEGLLRSSVSLAARARDASGRDGFVAASIGPYGAMLADGSEYTGAYGRTVAQLAAWHHRRLGVLMDAGADLLAIETIPSLAEGEAVLREVAGTGVAAWLSYTVDAGALRSGESLAEAFALVQGVDEIVAVGVNCCDPAEVPAAIAAARAATDKAIVVYPNSGEQWDAKNRRWRGTGGFSPEMIAGWRDAGATIIGGCCRIGPADIAGIAAVLAHD